MATEWSQDQGDFGKPATRRDRYERGLRHVRGKDEDSEIDKFDWFSRREALIHIPLENLQVAGEKISDNERKLRMLSNMSKVCRSCSMCDLGLKMVNNNDIARDPHVFSNSSISNIMLVYKSPDWDSLRRGESSNGNREKFDTELSNNGLSYGDFYACSLLRCHTDTYDEKHIDACQPFIKMEINLLKPKLMIAVGKLVFEYLCPDHIHAECVDKIVTNKYGIKTFPIYETNHVNFNNQLRKMSKIVSKILRR